MARKRSKQPSPLEPHVAEAVEVSINLYCPNLKCGGMVSILRCLFLCPKGRAVKCSAYTAAYPQLLTFTIPEKYITKYGDVRIPVPMQFRKRRKRRVPVVG